jgi:hypothetical protein
MSVINYSDLETKGFVVVPNVIPQKEIDRLVGHYRITRAAYDKRGTHNKNYNMLYAGPHKVSSSIAPVVTSINAATDMDIDVIAGLGSYFDSSILTFGWHQDHEPYFMWQMSDAYVNFWIPLIKPDRTKAGLCIVPFDALRKNTSQRFMEEKIFNKGARTFRTHKGKTYVMDADINQEFSFDISLDDIKVMPEVGPGDAIIMRGDCIHETHRTHTHRVAISIKALNCHDRVVTRDRFFNSSPSKMETLSKNKNDYETHIRKFVDEGVDSFRVRELFPHAPIHYTDALR